LWLTRSREFKSGLQHSTQGTAPSLALLHLKWQHDIPTFSSRRRSKAPPPGETGQEALYLRSLSDRQVIVTIKLRDGETVRGWIEYFDDAMLRLTREGSPICSSTSTRSAPSAKQGKRRDARAELGRMARPAPRGAL
jgi:hypothetical protein